MILGRPSLNTLGAVVSTPYLALKFPVGVVHVDQKEAWRCYNKSLRKKHKGAITEGKQEVNMVEIGHSKGMSMRNLDL